MAEEPRRNSSGLQGKFETLHEFVKAARFKLAPTTWDYVVGAAETETTLKRNRYAIDSVAFRPRVLNDITDTDASGTVMGKKARLPVMLAPVGGLERLDPEGAAPVARGAEQVADLRRALVRRQRHEGGARPAGAPDHAFDIDRVARVGAEEVARDAGALDVPGDEGRRRTPVRTAGRA